MPVLKSNACSSGLRSIANSSAKTHWLDFLLRWTTPKAKAAAQTCLCMHL
ncbi:MAG: hypothetical protein RM347_028235 [Nostoc sp. ChiQUE02]|nr:hypothetical protein [Nostoc sp. ChiQUE02]